MGTLYEDFLKIVCNIFSKREREKRSEQEASNTELETFIILCVLLKITPATHSTEDGLLPFIKIGGGFVEIHIVDNDTNSDKYWSNLFLQKALVQIFGFGSCSQNSGSSTHILDHV